MISWFNVSICLSPDRYPQPASCMREALQTPAVVDLSPPSLTKMLPENQTFLPQLIYSRWKSMHPSDAERICMREVALSLWWQTLHVLNPRRLQTTLTDLDATRKHAIFDSYVDHNNYTSPVRRPGVHLTTLRELDESVLTQTCRCESQSRLSN
jgi:hypothetical protein